MKKFIIVCVLFFLAYFGLDYLYYQTSFFIDLNPNAPIQNFAKTEGKKIYLDEGTGYEEYEIRGVDMGVGIPGHFATDYAIDKETYLRWFGYIQAMGANTIRVYTILHPDFYEAIYEYNIRSEKPLYVMHGLWVNDYTQNSHIDAYDDAFLGKMLDDSQTLVDVIHGKSKLQFVKGDGIKTYTKDISDWVIGYILGVEWEDVTVAYTDMMHQDKNIFEGTYMRTTWEASPFEAFLAKVGDNIIGYESTRYKDQRMVAFSNWPTTDPFDYPDNIRIFFKKVAKINVEHIEMTDAFIAGTFASYHIYPYYPDYLNYMPNTETYTDEAVKFNTYYLYLKMLNQYYSIPVIISEFGIPSSRGMTQRDANTGRSQGGLSEQAQGKAIVSCYEDIMAAGCAGSIIFSWQDEWFKRTWNTMQNIDLQKTPYWSDYQTNEQYFGLLSFDPGWTKSVSYVDGDISEWTNEDLVIENEESSVSIKYDEKFIYFLLYQKGFTGEQKLYIPIDLTPKTGSYYCQNPEVQFERKADFLLLINGKEESRVLVQERYNAFRAVFNVIMGENDPYVYAPDKNTPVFQPINLILKNYSIENQLQSNTTSEKYETGLLVYGNANPEDESFNSLADYCFSGEYIELKIPWQLLNFSNPSEMVVHDDYYEHYGIEDLKIDKLYVGIGTDEQSEEKIPMEAVMLNGWGRNVTYHERLKASYYYVQRIWAGKM